ncbi:MAG: DUF6084 family protein [Candidatus Eremiobacteraeota bacterium]|nr:DUF6084 family protein [Candidatus Eremiobacteraeota bacterium]
MSRLAFEVLGARAEPYAAAPLLSFRLRISEAEGEQILAIALRCQIRIEPRRRHYGRPEEERLFELFGKAERWGETLQTMLWTHVSAMVPAFSGQVEIDLPVHCTYDFDVASSKYLNALGNGDIPVLLLFSGTIFKPGPSGFSLEPVPWELEAAYNLPVSVWRGVMDAYFPNSAWIRLNKDAFDELYRFKSQRALPTWEDALSALLDMAKEKR